MGFGISDHQLQVFDQRLGARELDARLDQRCLERIYVVGESIKFFAFSPPLVDATCVAASASRSLREDSRAVPA